MRRRAPILRASWHLRPVLVLCAWLGLGGCAGFPYRAPPCSGEFVDASQATRRELHVRLLLTHAGREQRHELAIHSEPGLVSAVGLTPMGTLAYRVRHDADGVAVENRVGRYLGLDAERAWDAVVRGLLAPAPDVGAGDPVQVEEDTGAVRVANDACRYHARILVVSDRPSPDAPPSR